MLPEPILRLIVDYVRFLELTDEGTLKLDAAVAQEELVAYTLQQLSEEDRAQLLSYVAGLREPAPNNAYREFSSSSQTLSASPDPTSGGPSASSWGVDLGALPGDLRRLNAEHAERRLRRLRGGHSGPAHASPRTRGPRSRARGTKAARPDEDRKSTRLNS